MAMTERNDRGGFGRIGMNGSWKSFLFLAITTFGLTCGEAFAAGGNANCIIDTTPNPPVITAGQSVNFSGNCHRQEPEDIRLDLRGRFARDLEPVSRSPSATPRRAVLPRR